MKEYEASDGVGESWENGLEWAGLGVGSREWGMDIDWPIKKETFLCHREKKLFPVPGVKTARERVCVRQKSVRGKERSC